jgi:hypothetical protein
VGRLVAAVVLAAVLAAPAASATRAAARFGFVERTVSCGTSAASGLSSFNVEYTPYVGDGWFGVSTASIMIHLVEVGSGRGFEVNAARCRPTSARAPLTRKGIVGRWLRYESRPRCVLPGRVIVHVRGTVSTQNAFTGSVAVRMQPSGRRVAYAVFDRAGTVRAFVSTRCT